MLKHWYFGRVSESKWNINPISKPQVEADNVLWSRVPVGVGVEGVEDCLQLVRVEGQLAAHPLHVPLGDEALLLLGEQFTRGNYSQEKSS